MLLICFNLSGQSLVRILFVRFIGPPVELPLDDPAGFLLAGLPAVINLRLTGIEQCQQLILARQQL